MIFINKKGNGFIKLIAARLNDIFNEVVLITLSDVWEKFKNFSQNENEPSFLWNVTIKKEYFSKWQLFIRLNNLDHKYLFVFFSGTNFVYSFIYWF